MRFLFKGLLAATALLPVATAANAQDDPVERMDRTGRTFDRSDRADRGDRPAREAPPQRADPDRGGGPRWQDRGGDRAQPAPQPRPDTRPDGRPDRQPGDWNRPRLDPGRGDGRNGGVQRPDRPRFDGRPGDRDGWNRARPAPQQPGFDRRRDDDRGGWRGRDDRRYDYGNVRGGNWNRTWRDDGRYDWNRYRATNSGAYRLPRYYAPGGWSYGYRRFSVGVTLDSVLFDESYWIDDPYAYRLPEAYGPYRWVRYYDDALLVDVRYGRVVDVVYGIFW